MSCGPETGTDKTCEASRSEVYETVGSWSGVAKRKSVDDVDEGVGDQGVGRASLAIDDGELGIDEMSDTGLGYGNCTLPARK